MLSRDRPHDSFMKAALVPLVLDSSARTVISQVAMALCLVCAAGCSVVSLEGVQSVAVAPDEQTFVVNYHQGGESLVAIIEADGYIPTVLLRSQDGTQYDRPIFSKNGERVFFIRRKKRDQGDLYAIDTDGENLIPITNGQEGAENIQDIAASRDGEIIYFINSGFYGHYSPIAASHPHDMDFFSINKDGTGLEQLSYSNSYALYGVSIAPSADKIYSRSKILHLSKPRHFSDFDVSPFIAFSSHYPLSEFTDSGNVVLAAAKVEERKPGSFSSREELKLGEFSAVYGYGLFLVDVNNETVTEIIHLRSYLDSPALFHDQQRVLFVRNDSVWGGDAGRELWSVNIDGSNLHKIDLALMKEFD